MVGDQQGFGALLRRYRMAKGLTQEALAERAGLSLRGVSDLERGLRRVPYPDTVERLVEALGLGSAERSTLHAARRPPLPGIHDDGAWMPPRSAPPAPLTSFIGRERELGQIRRLLDTTRLLTLTGAGGVGKTRLAGEAAHEHGARFAQGVHFVSLAGVGSASLLASAVAAALGMSFYGLTAPNAQLVSYLHDKRLLLVLDNFEHLLDGTGLLTDILSGAPKVMMLVTSRERLNLQEEWVISIEGLPFPDRRTVTEPIDNYPAVQLFVQRAQQVQAGFVLADNVTSVIDVCEQVEGMPLALELAATWLRAMPCDQIALQIDRSLDFLTTPLRDVPDRHRSVRAVFDRSWSLLSDVERKALAQLSVFRSGFDLKAAEQVSGAPLGLLAGLVDKSLIRVSASGRYDLHELVRQYLSEKLIEFRDTIAVLRRHLDYYSALATQAEAQLYGPDQEAWYDRLEIESDNLAAALAWSLRTEHAEAGLRLAGALGFFWQHRGHFHDGYNWLEKLLRIDQDAPASVRAKALRTAASCAIALGEIAMATARNEESLALAREVGDKWNIAWSLADLGRRVIDIRTTADATAPGVRSEVFIDQYAPDFSHAAALLDEALSLFRSLGDGWGISHALRRLGWTLMMQGNYERAAMVLEEALTLARQVHNQHAVSWSLFSLGNVVWLQTKDPDRTLPLYRESLSLARQTRDQQNLGYVLIMLGEVAIAQGDFEQAQSRYDEVVVALRQARAGLNAPDLPHQVVIGFARLAVARGKQEQATRLFGAAHAFHSNLHLLHGDRGGLERDVAGARAELGEATFAAAFADGQAMTMEQALAYAIQAEPSG